MSKSHPESNGRSLVFYLAVVGVSIALAILAASFWPGDSEPVPEPVVFPPVEAESDLSDGTQQPLEE